MQLKSISPLVSQSNNVKFKENPSLRQGRFLNIVEITIENKTLES